jgi:hypothetical protein
MVYLGLVIATISFLVSICGVGRFFKPSEGKTEEEREERMKNALICISFLFFMWLMTVAVLAVELFKDVKLPI